MFKRMTGATIVVLILLLFVFATPFFMGILIKKEYPKLLAKLADQSNLQIKVLDYHRGWFSSNALVQVNSPASSKPALTLNEKIWHGLLIFAKTPQNSSKVLFARAYLTTNLQNPDTTFAADTVWTLQGSLKTNIDSPKFQFNTHENQIQFLNLKGNVAYSPLTDTVKTNTQMDALHLTQTKPNSSFQISLKNIFAQADFYKKQNLWYGTRQIQIGSFSLMSPNKPTITIDQMALKIEQTAHHDMTNIAIDYQAQQVLKENLKMGPVHFLLQLNDLDSKALADLITRAIQAKQQAMSVPTLIAQLYQPFFTIITKGFSITLNPFSFNTPQGLVSLSANIQIPKQAENPSIETLLKGSQIDAKLQVPQSWLQEQLTLYYRNQQKQAPQMQQNGNTDVALLAPEFLAQQKIKNWITQWSLVAKNDQLTLHVEYKKGQVFLNGQAYRKPTTSTP
jgi:uncharacterized protein YdgA (DUF945 family)